jgi:hypothetical protein
MVVVSCGGTVAPQLKDSVVNDALKRIAETYDDIAAASPSARPRTIVR